VCSSDLRHLSCQLEEDHLIFDRAKHSN